MTKEKNTESYDQRPIRDPDLELEQESSSKPKPQRGNGQLRLRQELNTMNITNERAAVGNNKT